MGEREASEIIDVRVQSYYDRDPALEDVGLMMGPLYHLTYPEERLKALQGWR